MLALLLVLQPPPGPRATGVRPGGQKTARITWQTSQASTRNVFTLKVKVKSGKTPLGVKCKVSKKHPSS